MNELRERDRPSQRIVAAARPPRFDARSAISLGGHDGRLLSLRQESPLRLLQPEPEPGDVPLVVIANTAGGIVGGDRLALSVEARDDARLLVTGQAAERVYRSNGELAELDLTFSSRRGAIVEVVPQGTIFFAGSRLRRRTRLETSGGGTLCYGEILHFGRVAMSEAFEDVLLDDRIEIRIDGRLAVVDALRIGFDPRRDAAAVATSRAGLAGARCAAVVFLLHRDAPGLLGAVRTLLGDSLAEGVRASAGCWDDGPLVVRWLGVDGASVRRSLGSFWAQLRHRVLARPARMPRIWSI